MGTHWERQNITIYPFRNYTKLDIFYCDGPTKDAHHERKEKKRKENLWMSSQLINMSHNMGVQLWAKVMGQSVVLLGTS